MKKRIKLYKTPEEQEEFYKRFIQRVSFQEALHRLCSVQKRELDYLPLYDKKIFPFQYTFSAS